MRTVHRLRKTNRAITLIKSNVGSTPTLTRTSMNLDLRSDASVTMRATSIVLVTSRLANVLSALSLDRTAIGGVHRGLN